MALFRKLFFVACSVSVGMAFSKPQNPAQFCAQAVVVIGNTVREPGGKSLVQGEKLLEGTRLKTDRDSFVKLLLNDQSVIDISPNTSFLLKSCAVPSIGGIDLELELGKVRANVNSEPTQPRKYFRMKTPTSVLAVRGTEFFVTWAQDSAGAVNERVSVSEGQVEIRSLFQSNASPTLLQTGTEYRAEGFLKGQNRPLPRVDQFNANEQRKLEREQRIEENVFINAIDLKRGNGGRNSFHRDDDGNRLGAFLRLNPRRELSSAEKHQSEEGRRNRSGQSFLGRLGNAFNGTNSTNSQITNAQNIFVSGTFFMSVKK